MEIRFLESQNTIWLELSTRSDSGQEIDEELAKAIVTLVLNHKNGPNNICKVEISSNRSYPKSAFLPAVRR